MIYGNKLPELRSLLGGSYIGTLPAVRGISKSEALRIWFTDKGVDLKKAKYAILDDQCEQEGYLNDGDFAKRCINTDAMTGLTDEDCEKARGFLAFAI